VNTDSSGSIIGEQGHYPFGDQWYLNSTITKEMFTTYERDAESGNDYAMARYHVNRLGRFSSPDPLAGDIGNPQSLNRYTYTQNDPVNLVDPFGMDPGFCDLGGHRRSFKLAPADCTGQGGEWVDTSSPSSDGDPFGDEEINIFFDNSLLGGGDGGDNTSDNIKPWELRSKVVAILRAVNDCSNWFNKGTGSAADVMSNVPITLFTPTRPSPIPHENADAITTSSPQSPISVSSIGRFYPDSANQLLVGGKFAPGSFGAQMVILFHELGHKINPPGFTNDSVYDPGASEKNTRLVIDNCLNAIRAAGLKF